MATTGSPFTSRRSAPATTAKSPREKPLFILTIPSVFWATTLSPFFKAYFHQEPDLANPLLTLCGYGAVRFKKKNPALWLGFVKKE